VKPDQRGAVSRSHAINVVIACSAESPHMSSAGWIPTQVAGRSGRPNNRHRTSSLRCGQRTPAGFPSGSAAHGEIEGAMQHAPQPGRQFMALLDRW